MTKKDFELIASALLESKYIIDSQTPISAERAREIIVHTLSGELATTNPRFDRARFLAACGVQS